MSGPSVLVVEDEQNLRRFLRASLGAHGFQVIEATTLGEARLLAQAHNPELVLLDLGLPDGDGMELVGWLREWSRAPVVVVSARGREEDKVAALDAGADDYLTKPFGVPELLARIRVALRHAAAIGAPGEPVVDCGGLRIDLQRRVVLREGAEIRLTPTEYRILALLARHAGKVLTHRQILREVWGPQHVDHVHYVRVYLAELRRKIEADASRPRWLLTEAGVGYRLREA